MNKLVAQKLWHLKHDKKVEALYHVGEVVVGGITIIGILLLGIVILSLS